MENRTIIFTDDTRGVVGSVQHDSSIIQSLPRVGDTILDRAKLDYQEEFHTVEAIVYAVDFDYEAGVVRIYAKVKR